MPYLRPDRKGLPDPPSNDGENMVRSESYLHLSDLGDASTSSQVDAAPASQPVPRSISSAPDIKRVKIVTPPQHISGHSSPKSSNMGESNPMDAMESPSQKPLKVNSPLHNDLWFDSPPQTNDNARDSLLAYHYPQRRRHDTSAVNLFHS